jgi:hypothetical protein
VQTEIRTMRQMQEAHDKKAQRALAVILEVQFANVQRRVRDEVGSLASCMTE